MVEGRTRVCMAQEQLMQAGSTVEKKKQREALSFFFSAKPAHLFHRQGVSC